MVKWTVWATLAGSLLALTACAGAVSVPDPSPSSTNVQAVCANVIRSLPSAVQNLARRSMDPPEAANVAAWGNPPVTLRCGVATPTSLTPTSEILSIASVDWYPEKRSAGYVFVTVGRVANVEVSVPNNYQPETAALPDLANAIKSSDPLIVPEQSPAN